MISVYLSEYQLVIKILRDAHIEKGITQAKLAKALDRPQSFIANATTNLDERKAFGKRAREPRERKRTGISG